LLDIILIFSYCSVISYETQNIAYIKYTSERRWTNLGHQFAWATKFCAMTPNVVRSSEWNWLHVTLLAPINWRWSPICLVSFCTSVSQEWPCLEKLRLTTATSPISRLFQWGRDCWPWHYL